MKKYLTVLAAFVVMLCIGSVYAWSIVAAELMTGYGFSGAQSQTIFGTLIAVFPVAMIFVGRPAERWSPRFLGLVSGVLFFCAFYRDFSGDFCRFIDHRQFKVNWGRRRYFVGGTGAQRSPFSVANFLGRLTWVALSDHWSASLNVFMALLLQGVAIAPPYLG